jgi:tRNA (guanine-N7-)-methyltransferase
MSTRYETWLSELKKEQRGLKASQHRVPLWNGWELQYHKPNRSQALSLDLLSHVPEPYKKGPIELEVGPGKGEFIAARAARFPNRFFLGIDRRSDRVASSTKKLQRQQGQDNWLILREDACSFDPSKLPSLEVFHLYQPDPWPKNRHHKHRFFRAPEAKAFAHAVRIGGELRLSTDHLGYFIEMIDLVKTWGSFDLITIYEKNFLMSEPMTHFEGIFLKKKETVFKAYFQRAR